MHFAFQHLIQLLGMIKNCMWKGLKISCSAIFSMQPTDQGMCCSFNKRKADEMFNASPYQEQLTRLAEQDKKKSRLSSEVPEWQDILKYVIKLVITSMSSFYRYELTPESGKHKGLSLILDAHRDILSTSSALDNFRV